MSAENMSAEGQPTTSEALADVLREHPPALDDLAKARIEKNLIAAAGAPASSAGPARPAKPAKSRAKIYAFAGVAAAAAALLVVFATRPPATPTVRLVVSPVSEGSMAGTLEEGSTVRTDASEQAGLHIADSRVHIEPSTDVRLERLEADRIDLALGLGEIRVEFHPQIRGEEHLTVRTAHAQVDVVGTVFTVRVTETSTEVSVTEGRVRVRPHGEAMRSVGAGESTLVGEPPVVASTVVRPATAPTAPPPGEGLPASPRAPAEIVATPAQRLARARALVRREDYRGAETILVSLLRVRGVASRTRAEAFTVLGDLQRRAGRHEEAARAYEGAARAGSGTISDMAIFALARLQERDLRDTAAARRSYERYLEAAPGGPLSGQAYQALCRIGGGPECEER